MHDDRSLVEHRLARALRQRIQPALYGETSPLDIEIWRAPGEPVPVDEALAADYKPAAIGDPWGAPWGTAWFRLSGQIPAAWDGRPVEAVVDLGFDGGPGFSAEGLAYTPDGEPIKGLSPDNRYVPVNGYNSGGVTGTYTALATGGADFQIYVEAAANPTVIAWPDFAPTKYGDKETAGDEPLYQIRQAELALVNVDVWHLLRDIEVLQGLMTELPLDLPRRPEILRGLERALDALDYDDIPGTADAAREQLAPLLAKPAYASAHRVSAVGHAHIDSAWLWPLRETVRKVARTVSNVTALAKDHPGFRFAFSQAQQHAWMKEHHPKVWQRLKEAVENEQVIPIGGMWVESDTNMPGGEAMARQFVHGKRFFLEEYGIETDVVWLPDSFGYSAAMPQLVKLSNSTYFLTQKISWNQTNKFPHHTFWWEGIDGTKVFTHFPPADTYNGQITGEELARAQRQYADQGGGTLSLLPFGHGDGGGGPTREMLDRANRVADLEASPRVTIEHPGEFFAKAEAEYDAPVWLGELYLELHRATYTSQAKTKQGNRRSEHLLREAELWSAAAAVAGTLDYPYDDLDRIWKAVLLNQFHDILPGSSIRWVHREAEETYAQLAVELEALIGKAQRALAGEGDETIVFNATPHAVHGVPALGAAVPHGSHTPAVTVTEKDATIVVDNGLIRVTIDERGLLTSVYEIESEREAIAPGKAGNLLQLHVDTPNVWDAWDVDPFYRNKVTDLVDVDSIEVISSTEEEVAVAVRRMFLNSSITQTISVRSGQCQVNIQNEIDWHEKEKFLKAAFPLDVRAERSASETQFGHVYRATHTNTSWENAKFEVCAHRWIHVEEPGYGHAIVNNSTYGHDVTRESRPDDGGTTTTVRLSLLRAPRVPDPVTDQGTHILSYTLVPGAGIPEAVEEGYRINLPARTISGARGVEPLVEVDNPAVVVESVKLADDRGGDVVVRLYEAHGGRAKARLTTSFELGTVVETDLLERPLLASDGTPIGVAANARAERLEVTDGGVDLALRPFQVLTLRLKRNPGGADA